MFLPRAGAMFSLLSPTGSAVDVFELCGRILVKVHTQTSNIPNQKEKRPKYIKKKN